MPQHCIRGNASIRNPYISYILILREIRNVPRGNKCDIQWLCWVYQFHRLAPFSLVSSYSWHLILIKQLTPKHKWFISVLWVERKRPTLLVFYCPCHKHLFQVRQIVRFSWKLEDKWWNSFNEISTHLTTHHYLKEVSFQTRLKLFRTQWALMRLAESLTFIHGGLNENLFQYKRNSVAACKKFEAHKKVLLPVSFVC